MPIPPLPVIDGCFNITATTNIPHRDVISHITDIGGADPETAGPRQGFNGCNQPTIIGSGHSSSSASGEAPSLTPYSGSLGMYVTGNEGIHTALANNTMPGSPHASRGSCFSHFQSGVNTSIQRDSVGMLSYSLHNAVSLSTPKDINIQKHGQLDTWTIHSPQPRAYGMYRGWDTTESSARPVNTMGDFGRDTVNISTKGGIQSAETPIFYSKPSHTQATAAAPSAQPGPSLKFITQPDADLESYPESTSQTTPAPAPVDREMDSVIVKSKLKLIACCVSTCDRFILGLRSLEEHIRDDHGISPSHNNAYICPHPDCTQHRETRQFTKYGLRSHARKAHRIEYKFNDKSNANHKPSSLELEIDADFELVNSASEVYLSCPWYKCNKKSKAGSFMRHILTHSRVTLTCPVRECRFRSSRWLSYNKHFKDIHPGEMERNGGKVVYLERRQEDFRYNWRG